MYWKTKNVPDLHEEKLVQKMSLRQSSGCSPRRRSPPSRIVFSGMHIGADRLSVEECLVDLWQIIVWWRRGVEIQHRIGCHGATMEMRSTGHVRCEKGGLLLWDGKGCHVRLVIVWLERAWWRVLGYRLRSDKYRTWSWYRAGRRYRGLMVTDGLLLLLLVICLREIRMYRRHIRRR